MNVTRGCGLRDKLAARAYIYIRTGLAMLAISLQIRNMGVVGSNGLTGQFMKANFTTATSMGRDFLAGPTETHTKDP